MESEEVIGAVLGSISAAALASAVSTAGTIASTAMTISEAGKGTPKIPVPDLGPTPQQEAARRAEALAAKNRQGRVATMLTQGLGGTGGSVGGSSMPPKSILGV
jgi:hypothetical protein